MSNFLDMKNDKPADPAEVLERFMKEFFPFDQFKEIGFFTEDMRGDFEKQAKKVCTFFGYKTVYEYRSKRSQVHLSYAPGKRPIYVNEKGQIEKEPFVTVFESIYES